MALYRDGRIVDDDPWIFPRPDEIAPGDRCVAVRRDDWLATRDALSGRASGTGLLLAAGESLAPCIADLPRFDMIALEIPRFTDGRPYSLARLLRQRHGFRGELRARGDVLQDQITFLLRCGFDTLEIRDPATITALREGRITSISRHYQPAAADATERAEPAFGWRRLSDRRAPAGSGGSRSG